MFSQSKLGAAATASGLLLLSALARAQGFGGPPTPGPAALDPDAEPVRSCESLAGVALPDTTIESAAVDGNLCRVPAVTTHPPAGDRVTIWVAIPMTGWNGRFMGTGGGGFSGGSAGGVNQPAAQGYAAGATDTGHEGGSGSFALDAGNRLAWQLIRDNAHVGIHEMTVTGKSLTEALYGEAPGYSYFNGCSTGGRQALMEAQRYPEDYDGVVAGAPAINWPKLHVQQLWGPMLMQNEGNPVAPCKLARATAAAIEACDTIDHVEDGVIEDPARCDYDPAALIGSSTADCAAFTAADASIISRIWDGPTRADGSALWIGAPRGSDLAALSNSSGDPLRPQAMFITLDWFKYFLTADANFDWTTVTPAGYERLFDQSVEQFGTVIGTDNPDLSAFRDRGGKAVVWHGWADQLISAHGTVDYYDRVVAETGGLEDTQEFIRLFMAPGVGHCAGGNGPQPGGQIEALIDWVENDRAPDMLTATLRAGGGRAGGGFGGPPGGARGAVPGGAPGGAPAGARGGAQGAAAGAAPAAVIRTRPLCPYPLVSVYRGRGSTDEAASFACREEF
jgi:feruloyl esterase